MNQLSSFSGELAAAVELEGVEPAMRRVLRKREIEIARKYHGGTMWPYVAGTLVGFALWLGLFPLTMFGLLSLPLACAMAVVLMVAGYVAAHEAMHDNIAPVGSRTYWINRWVGRVASFPLAIAYMVARITHLQHHVHCNDPDKDPDSIDAASGPWSALYKSWLNRQPGVEGSIQRYLRLLRGIGTPDSLGAIRATMLIQLTYLGVLFTMAWNGFALEAAMVWWLPRQIALSFIRVMLSWAPHHPHGERRGRYRNTRVFRTGLGPILSVGTETHLVHHLYPGIPTHRTLAAYHDLRLVLEARGVDCSAI